MTLVSLTPGPLLELVCAAAQRQLSSVWLSLATKLIFQLNPSVDLFNVKRAEASPENEAVLLNILPVLLQTVLSFFSLPNTMEEVLLLSIHYTLDLMNVTESRCCTRVFWMYESGLLVILNIILPSEN